MHIRRLLFVVFLLWLVPSCAPEPALQIVISPAEPTTADTLLATIETDTGAPAEGSFQFRWHQDGLHREELDNLNLVPSAQTHRSEVWQVVATVTRGDSDPVVLQSNSIVILNSPPSISGVVLSPAEATAATQLHAEVLG